MIRKICIGTPIYNDPVGGEKARIDSINIASTMNDYQVVPISCIGEKLQIKDFRPILELHSFSTLSRIKNSLVFIQHPFPLWSMNFTYDNLAKHNKIILLSHDLDFLRSENAEKSAKIVEIYNKASCLISLNKHYTEFLRQIGVTIPIVELGIWCYLYPNEIMPSFDYCFSKKISFVGNLTKSEFLTQFVRTKRSYTIELIGRCTPSQQEQFSNNESCEYKGVYSSDDVPFQISGSFGLIWDGPSLDYCGGLMGTYQKYNTPHKTSLYLSVGIPIIVWNKAAIADFVRENKVGFVIENLNEIEEILNRITKEEYIQIKENIKPIRTKIMSGEYLQKALNSAESIILN